MNNKMKKFVMAVLLITSILASSNVGYANGSLQSIVDQARKDMKEAAYSYVVPAQNGTVATSEELYPALNLAKMNYQKARSAIQKANVSNRDALLKDLDALYEERISKGILPYIDAYNYTDKYLNSIMADIKKAESTKDWEKVEALYHKLSVQLKSRTVILYRFSGKAARDLLLDQYKEPANQKRDQLMIPVTIYMKVKEADKLLAAGKKEEAIKILESIKPLVIRLPSPSDLPMVKELIDKVTEVSKKAGMDIIIPTPMPAPTPKAPVATNIPAMNLKAGQSKSINLMDYFSNPDADELTFTSTLGTIKGSVLTLDLEAGTYIVGVTGSDGDKEVTTQFSVVVSAAGSPTDNYYKDALGKEGAALKAALHEIIDDHTELSYSQVWDALKETDEDPKNKNNVILFYSGKSRSKTANGGNVGQWNREHTWAKSHGDFGTSKGPGTDIHHLRPTDVQVNSARGNLDFDNGGSPVSGCDGCYKTKNSFEPPDRVKGDVARILFYMATRYEAGDRVDLELNEKLNNGSAPFHGKLSVLLEWHEQDPVDEFELNRNNVIQEWQGNRNPFIDHPEWVELIWGEAGSLALPKAS